MSSARKYSMPRKGVFVPRWILVVLGSAALLWVGLKILVPPSHEIQRLDSPNGKISARLMRTEYAREHFTILTREGHIWQRVYYGPPITNDYRTDTFARLHWSTNSRILYFSMNDSNIWAYSFQDDRAFIPK